MLAGSLDAGRVVVDASPRRRPESLSYSTRGHLDVDVDAVEQRPEMRFWYLVMVPAEQVQVLSRSP